MGSVFGKDSKVKGTAGSKSNNTSMNSKSNITEKVIENYRQKQTL
jgi:hypothetical protein